MRIRFNSDDNLPLKKKDSEIYGIVIIISSAFYTNDKDYLQIILDECLQKLNE